MKLVEFLTGVGQPLYYYPSLARIFGVKGAIFLCNFIAWTGSQKDPDGWIYKSQSEIETETGMNDKEQATARNRLKNLGVIEEKYIRLQHKMLYRVVVEQVDFLWANRETGFPETRKPGMGKPEKRDSTKPGITVSSIEALSTQGKQACIAVAVSGSNGTISTPPVTVTPESNPEPPNANVVSPQPDIGVLEEIPPSEPQPEAETPVNGNVAPKEAIPKPAEIVLNYLNKAAGRKFRPTALNLKRISARLKSVDGDVPGVCQMIDRQVKRWTGTEYEQYLQPSTLFGPEKFDGYYDSRDFPVYAPKSQPNASPSGPAPMDIRYKKDDLPP